jgi:subtilisin-like proprotein convertase family protein
MIKVSITDLGFQAMIFSPKGNTFIDPYHPLKTQDYIVYRKEDFKPYRSFVCETNEDHGVPNKIYSPIVSGQNLRSQGATLRTYRLALACTGEYAAFYGATVSGAISGMIASMLRVNGVYESEVAIRMVLIANNANLVYLNAATDPYTNNNGSTLLGQNQANIDAVIGTANYDIGHIFSTGGGGVAVLNSPCSGSSKARGVTGLGSPVGDAFDIDYVAHEIGHQFGALHTFNSSLGSCTSNRSASAAFEPGSGITIMAYAGICSTDNLSPNSIAYFHVFSIDQINTFITTGGGSTCGASTSTGNTPPNLSSTGTGYNIPLQTPFYLTATGSDPNGDPITYSWEEYDLGAQGVWNAPLGDAPIFRPFNPTTNPVRIFPKIQDLVRNVTVIGELLPTYARTLKFKVTARDNRVGGGGLNRIDDTVRVNVINTSVPFKVTSPNTAISWTTGTTQTLTWDVASSAIAPINCSNVKITMSLDSGYTYPITIYTSTPNDGSETFVVPNYPTNRGRIKVEAVGNIFFDISDVNFNVITASPTLTSLYVAPLSTSNLCSGQNLNVSFTGDGPANAGNIYTAQLSNSSGSFASPTLIGTLTSTASTGTISCTLPILSSNVSGYLIRVVSSNPAVVGFDNGTSLSIFGAIGNAGTITGAATICQGITGVSYSIPAVANATKYVWTLPNGVFIVTGANTNSITVNALLMATSGNVTVTPSSACGNGLSSTFSVTINPLPGNAGVISGVSPICKGSMVTFSVPVIPNALNYNWTVPAGFTINGGSNSNSISVTIGASAVSGNVTVNASNSCGTGATSTFSVAIQTPPSAPVISAGGPTTVCGSGSVTLSVTPVPGLNYQWRKDGIEISGETGTSYLATSNGVYDVIATENIIIAQTFLSSGRVSIPDNSCAGATSNIAVSGYSGTIDPAKIYIRINVTHTYVGDLAMFLESPTGVRLGLSNQTGNTGNGGDNFTNTVFADSGSVQIPTAGAPYTGLFKPWQSLFTVVGCSFTTTATSFAGLSAGSGNISPNGIWALKAYDRFSTDTGSVQNWQITFPGFNPICSVTSNSISFNIVNQPSIASFSPIVGNVGTNVIINGSDLTGITGVSFNGVPASSFLPISSTQISAVVPAGATTGLITLTKGGCSPAVSVTNFTVNSNSVLNVTVLIQGFYQGAGTMIGVVSSNVSDLITVELHNSSSPFALVHSSTSTLDLNGFGSFQFPSSVIGNSYYIVLKHRNSIETWSKIPVTFGTLTNYNFTNL